ncbi:thiamine pyrophosphate-binding protein [Auritidibacter ignavus]|uniref:thiamine pyrophosphate-binding protein n=1 Tax=Auritidibacter ignavus TaxID=678932 RepID=UPI0024472E54|nr:thiamine pyrophosphate-binding protein [Auritidibacter ignavus]WGH82938.1 thiamine pyrophosphate-binding protein [Auritidibacter ignavus]
MTEQPGPPTLTQRMAEILADHGLTHVFGVVGSGNFHLTNHLIAAGIDFTAARHEGAAASMADAYTRLASLDSPETRDRPELNPTGFAAVSVHQGSGLTNLVTGLTEATKSGTGMLVLTAETPLDAEGSNVEIDQFGVVEAVGALPLRITDPNEVATVLDEVFHHLARRKTVVLNLPTDVQTQPVTAEVEVPHRGPRTGTIPQLSQVTRAAKSLQHAERPVILAGRGALHARTEIIALADTAGALLTTSAVANGLFEGHPWNLGISGGFSSPATAELISQADLILSFGCALNDWTTRHGALINDEATLIQVDHSPWAIGKFREVSQTLIADSAAVAEAVDAELARLQPQKTGYRTDQVRTKLSAKYFNDIPLDGGDLSTQDRIDPRVLSAKLNRILPAQRVVTTDSGNFMGYPVAYLRVPDVRGFCFTQAFQSIGLGLGTLVGSAFAEPTRMPVLGTGDGGFAMGISELETLVRLQIPAVVIIYNDAAYGAEAHHFGLYPTDTTHSANPSDTAELRSVTFPDTDFARIATGYGAHGITVRTAEDLAQVTEWLNTAVSTNDQGRLTGAPLIVDAKIASDHGAWWHEVLRAPGKKSSRDLEH